MVPSSKVTENNAKLGRNDHGLQKVTIPNILLLLLLPCLNAAPLLLHVRLFHRWCLYSVKLFIQFFCQHFLLPLILLHLQPFNAGLLLLQLWAIRDNGWCLHNPGPSPPPDPGNWFDYSPVPPAFVLLFLLLLIWCLGVPYLFVWLLLHGAFSSILLLTPLNLAWGC